MTTSAQPNINTMNALTPTPIIIDTDLFSDVDDIGALAVANSLHNCGLADLRAIMLNTHSEYGSLAASAITTHFSNPTIPIAAIRPLTQDKFTDTRHHRLGEYASKLANTHNFPRTLQSASSTPEPVDLYRSTLAAAPKNASVTLISIGFLTNLAALLNSPPDEHSPLTGLELVAQKVAELVIMGGRYPSSSRPSWNFSQDVPAATIVLAKWPGTVPITFSGSELGSKIFTGQNLEQLAGESSPVLAAWRWYANGHASEMRRASWDPVTVLYAVLGVGEIFEFANKGGSNSLLEDGSNEWVDEGKEDRGQHWLRLKDGVTDERVGEMLESLYVRSDLEDGCCLGICGGGLKVQGLGSNV